MASGTQHQKREDQCTDSCDFDTHDRTNTDTIPFSSAVSPGVNSEVLSRRTECRLWGMWNKSVAQCCFLLNFGSVGTQVALLQETQNFKYADDSFAGLGGVMLRKQRGSNGRGAKSGFRPGDEENGQWYW